MGESRWTFTLSHSKASKFRAWIRCVRAGLRVGIPRHAWLKRHTDTHWSWHTDTPDQIELRGRAAKRRREKNHG